MDIAETLSGGYCCEAVNSMYSNCMTSNGMSSNSMKNKSTFDTAAYGGGGWQPRDSSHWDEIGDVWGDCGIDSEWRTLRSVIVHRPGRELEASLDNPDQVQMLERVDWGKAAAEHDQMVEAYRNNGVEVDLVQPREPVSPNQMFCADLFAMTPQGAILARPASVVRAGEEVQVARCLAQRDVPILSTLTGHATFEGADMIWVNRHCSLVGPACGPTRKQRGRYHRYCTISTWR